MTIFQELSKQVGQKIGTSPWYDVPQELINQFSASTLDSDPMHLDPDWSRRNTPFGGTIAAGFWTTSMLITMSHALGFPANYERLFEASYTLNYGFNKHRLISPVPVGSRIRGHLALLDVQQRKDDSFLFTLDAQIEIEDEPRPALIAEWLALIVPRALASAG